MSTATWVMAAPPEGWCIDDLPGRGRPRPVPGPRRVRVRGARGLLRLQEGRAHRAGRDPARHPAAEGRGRGAVLPHPRPVDRRGGLMPAFPRQELEEMVERWIEANRRAEAA